MENIVKKPILTEKSLMDAGRGWFTFAVSLQAQKPQIAAEIAKRYSVTVKKVRTMRMSGKTRRTGRRMIPRRKSDWKKAVVLLKEGQTIEAFQITETQGK